MNPRILESVVGLTENNDIDSLDLSLLSTLSEYIPCRQLGIFLSLRGTNQQYTLLKLGLDIVSEQPHFRWQTNELVTQVPKQLQSCLHTGNYQKQDSELGYSKVWVPLGSPEQRVCLFVECCSLDSDKERLLSAFCRIYGNYIALLGASQKDKLTGLYSRHSFETRLKFLLDIQLKIQKEERQNAFDEHDSALLNSEQDSELGFEQSSGLGLEKNADSDFESTPVVELAKKSAAVQRAESPAVNNELRVLQQDDNALPWLVMFDLDNFKTVNDSFGHICGDEVLLSFAQHLRKFFRSSDLIFRFGGEEFVLILEATAAPAAIARIDAFRQSVADMQFPLVGKMTVSGGMTAITPNVFETVLLDQADKALYYAKENGRNAVHCYENLVAENKIFVGREYDDVQLF